MSEQKLAVKATDTNGIELDGSGGGLSLQVKDPAPFLAHVVTADVEGPLVTGQGFTITDVVTNSGDAAADGVTETLDLSEAPRLQIVTTPAAQDIPVGETVEFVWAVTVV